MPGLSAHAIACAAFLALAAWPAALVAAPTPHTQTDAERAELKGPVKEVATSFRREGPDPDERRLGVAHYDPQGWLTEDVQFTPDFVRTRTPKRLDRNTTLFTSAMGAATEHYQFDASGEVTETQLWYSDKPTGPPDQITRTTYDAQGRSVEERLVDPDGKLRGVTTYKRDATGNVVQQDEWLNDRAGPHAVSTYAYTLDAHGNWTQRRQKRTGVDDDDSTYGAVGTLIRTITYYGE